MQTAEILGYKVSAEGLIGDIRSAWQIIQSGEKGLYVACLNPHSVVVATTDTNFQAALSGADILLPDGAGIVLAARILGEPIEERVAGTEFFLGLTMQAQKQNGLKYFFLGATDYVLQQITERLQKEFPNVEVAGTLSPSFKDEFSEEENMAMVERINQCRPDVLWVGMTAPKQEKWIFANRHRLNVPLVGAIGAVFDFYAGTRERAPAWLRNLGLEWLPRLLREPKRLFHRNLVSSPLFLYMVLCEKLKRKRS